MSCFVGSAAHEYANKENDLKAFSLRKEHFKALKELRENDKIVISRPDKGRATVIMNASDYVSKMLVILDDTSKFHALGPVATHDKTARIETSINSLLSRLKTSGEISDEQFDAVRAIGSTRPRLYGLPKIHKNGCPLRPILSMTGSPQFAVSKWLCQLLEPVVKKYNIRCVRDSFEFVDMLKENPIPSSAYMCSFDIVSLFTNVPLDETIDICADALYRGENRDALSLSENSFRELLRMLTSGVEFSFNNIMYRQIDGVAMGSPLGPVLANIFVGYCESLVPESMWPPMYCRFVDDSFAHCENREQGEELLQVLNNLHPALVFTCESEHGGRLPFLEVLVEKVEESSSVTSVYRKPTFTGLYITWDSFCATKYKVNLVKNLVYRARRICSESRLQQELDKLRSIFLTNGYPIDLLRKLITCTDNCNGSDAEFGPKRCPVFLRLPWKGCWSTQAGRKIKSAVKAAYFAVDVNIVYSTTRAFRIVKDVLPTQQRSHLIYEFECRQCECRYVGRTLQRLNSRVRQHVPLHLLTSNARVHRPTRGRPRKAPVAVCEDRHQVDEEQLTPRMLAPRRGPPRACKNVTPAGGVSLAQPNAQKAECTSAAEGYQSSVARHLVQHDLCARAYDDTSFRVLSYARSKHHLEIMEAMYIRSRKPELCTQKQSVTTLRLFHFNSDTHAP